MSLSPFVRLPRLAAPLVIGAVLLVACATTQRWPPSVPGVEPPAALDDEVRQARAMLSLLAEQAVGLSVAVAREGQIVWSEAYGYRDVEGRQAATPMTLFRLYSLSKPMTAAAAARLLEQGRLDANASVQSYVSAFPDKGTPITPMQLAMHTSGIRHYADETEARSRQHCTSVAEALEIFANDPLLHSPGTQETYSSWGYVLLSAVLEGAASEEYERVMTGLVFQPLGMNSPAIDDPRRQLPTRARFHQESAPGTFVPADEVDNTCKWGAGAWLATAEDVARFGLALVDGSLLQPRTRQLFLRGQSVYRAQGVGAGGAAFLVVDDERKLSIALLSNAIGETLGPALQSGVSRLHAIFGGRGSAWRWPDDETVRETARGLTPGSSVPERAWEAGFSRRRSFSTRRYAAAVLPVGRVLVIGGSDRRGYDGRFSSMEIYDPGTGRFSPGPELQYGRHKIRDAVAALPSGAVVVAGGALRPELYDPADRVFVTARGELAGPQMFATASVLKSGDVLVLGGYDQRPRVAADAWIITAAMTAPRR